MHVYKIIGTKDYTYDVGYWVPSSAGSAGQWILLDSCKTESQAQELVSFLNGGAKPSWWNPTS